jgi:hypothetical protein
MAAFDPTIFGVGVTELRSFCGAMLTPTLGFAFLYLLGRPLRKLPMLDMDSDYQPPRWVLPIFALGSVFVISVAFVSSIFLSVLKSTPSEETFIEQYERIVDLTPKSISQPISSASIELDGYDGASTFQFFVNGYRLFSSEVNCMMKYQCRPPSELSKNELKAVNSVELQDRSLHNIHSLYVLPHSESFLYYLVPGLNNLDIISSNSGVGDCNLSIKILITAGGTQIKKALNVLPDSGPPPDLTNDMVTFHSYNNESLGTSDRTHPYGTIAANASYRLCERVKLKMSIEAGALSDEVKNRDSWTRWAVAKRNQTYCEILNGTDCH